MEVSIRVLIFVNSVQIRTVLHKINIFANLNVWKYYRDYSWYITWSYFTLVKRFHILGTFLFSLGHLTMTSKHHQSKNINQPVANIWKITHHMNQILHAKIFSKWLPESFALTALLKSGKVYHLTRLLIYFGVLDYTLRETQKSCTEYTLKLNSTLNMNDKRKTLGIC